MFRDDSIEVWNLTSGGIVETGCQKVVTVVGRLLGWDFGTTAVYRLNGGPSMPIAVCDMRLGRLCEIGDFGIDSICRDALLDGENSIEIEVRRSIQRARSISRLTFTPRRTRLPEPKFDLVIDSSQSVEEVGQVVDGRWSIGVDDRGANVRIAPGHEGYDRIVLFGDEAWDTNYEIITEFTIDGYPTPFSSFGPVFRWQPHVQGDGSHLPRAWTSALAIYSSGLRGLTLRSGLAVEYGADGSRSRHALHAARRASTPRATWSSVTARVPWIPHVPEFPVGRALQMRVAVCGSSTEVSIEPSGWSGIQRSASIAGTLGEPPVNDGAVGFLAAGCSVRIHRFEVRPIRH